MIADPCQIESNRGDVDDAEAREEAREAAQHEENLARQISRHQRRDSEKHDDEKSDSREKLRRRRTPWKDLIPRLKLMYAKWWDADTTLSRKFSSQECRQRSTLIRSTHAYRETNFVESDLGIQAFPTYSIRLQIGSRCHAPVFTGFAAPWKSK